MLVALSTVVLAFSGGQAVTIIAAAPPPAEVRHSGDASTQRVCRYERATGSNLQQRVCRNVPRQGVQDQQTREFMRSTQRIRTPDEG